MLNGSGGKGGLVPRAVSGYHTVRVRWKFERAALHGLLLNLGQRIDKPDGRAFVIRRGVERPPARRVINRA